MPKHLLLLMAFATLFSCKSDEQYQNFSQYWEYGNLTNQLYDNGGWMWQYPKGMQYSIGIDSAVFVEGRRSAHIFSEEDSIDSYAALLSDLPLEHVLARKVRLTCKAKSEDIEGWGGIWYRVDKPYDPSKKNGLAKKFFEGIKTAIGMDPISEWTWAFNNMHDNPITGTTDWKEYLFTFDVPQQTGGVSFGALLSGKGKFWVDDFKYTIIGTLPTDSTYIDKSSYIAKPEYLGFETY